MSGLDDPNDHLALHPHPSRLTKPAPFFHPTHALLVSPDAVSSQIEPDATHWSSRASRKKRYTPRPTALHRHGLAPTAEPRALTSISPMVTVQRMRGPTARLKVHLAWDISLWVAVAFVVGSACWICNGHLLYTPISPTPSPPHANAAAWLAFAGGTAFEISAYLAYVESLPINTGHEDLYQEFHEHQANLTGDGKGVPGVSVKEEAVKLKKTWQRSRWIGTGSLRDIGFLASAVQLLAASVFWISTLTGLPNVIPTLAEKNTPVSVVLFWTPQVIGGTGFMVASVLLMLEEQKKWWRISPLRIGWQVAFWNLVGAVGFTLCGALGYAAVASSKANYQSILSTFWGSWAFMIGSVIQLWETLWREDSKSSSIANAPSPNDKDTPVQKEQSSDDGHAD